jgi:spore coat polysaccharide biosynthesis protein SpsF
MRKLVAALACRAEGSRLYGKPLQNLDVDRGITILDHMVSLIQTIPVIEGIVLGVAVGATNEAFIKYAREKGIGYIVGSEKDVLHRLILCGQEGKGTDIFRVTTESPFFYFEKIEEAWNRHREASNDVTTIDGLPEGCHFEIYTLEALKHSHENGNERHRSEFCSLYIREHRKDFKVEVLPVPREVERLDLRLTVDYPEDLVLCRAVYANLQHKAPRIPLTEIVKFLDSHPELTSLVKPFVVQERLW